ncbi:MAG: glutamate--tRNA ligase [Candidatus Aminicenantes bacterium]|nr:MAG: glutamate--tRNA ligase [Candidatus Aminicenantes bacterium]
MEKVRVRFAPSPTGFLHVGNARTALFNWLFARKKKGVFILRVEDTDIERSAAEYEEKLIKDLLWMGLDWDEGPDAGGPLGPYRQSLRLEIYKSHTQRLLEEGKAYYCFCSPEELEREREKAISSGEMPVYSGKCRSIPSNETQQRVTSGEQAAVRLHTPDEGTISYNDLVRGTLTFDLKLIGDPILVRSNGLPSYNYAVVIDDSLMQITHVIRGEDHISNTPRQTLVYQALSLKPPQFAHLSLVMGKDNTRLSKRHGATSVDQFGKQGILSSALFNYMALLGWAPPEGKEVLTRGELTELFELEKVSRHSAIFDYDKLTWVNRQHMKRLSSRERAELAYPFLKEAKLFPDQMTEDHWEWLEKAVEVLTERIDRFSEFPEKVREVFEFFPAAMDESIKKELKAECASRVIQLFSKKISEIEEFDYAKFASLAKEIERETDCRGRDLYHPLRIALTARGSGLDLDKFIPLVEKGARLDFPVPVKNCAQRASEVSNLLE